MKTCSLIVAVAVAGVLVHGAAAQLQPVTPEPGIPPKPVQAAAAPVAGTLFQVEPEVKPKVTISWPRRDGTTAVYQAERAYSAPEQKGPLAPNLNTYIATGGNRGDAGAADPRGAIVKVGFYKADVNRPFFENIADDASVTVELSHIKFTRAARPEPQTALQHGMYEDPNSVLGCAISKAAATAMGGLDFYNTVDPNDNLAGKITRKNGRLGSLAGKITARVEADGTVTMVATLPYAGLKHPDDPWLRTNPGDFAEPFHFHVEMEVLPVDAGERQQGTSPSKPQKPA